jgi:phosphoribosyl 1,2-cyclic phosphodiesterase
MFEIIILASGSKGNCYFVTDGSTNILLDAGISWKEIQVRSGFRKIDLALVTHSHGDHSKCIPELLKFGIETYAPADCFKKRHHNAFNAISGDGSVFFNTWKVMPFDLVHDVPCVGYLIEHIGAKSKLVYITDTMYCKYRFTSVTHWLIECNYSKDIIDNNVVDGLLHVSLRNRVVQSHMSIETVKGLFLANDLSKTKEIWLLHLSDANSDEAGFKREIQEATGKPVYIAT